MGTQYPGTTLQLTHTKKVYKYLYKYINKDEKIASLGEQISLSAEM